MTGMPRRPLAAWTVLPLLLAVVLIAYRDALGAWFAADDFLWLSSSNWSDVGASFVGRWGHGPGYRPLTRLSFLVDATLFGTTATGWHLHNLLLHVAAASLLAILVERLSGERALALAAAVIFALLPLSYESTVWISGRMYPLGLTLALSTLLLFDRFLLAPSTARCTLCALCLTLTLMVFEGVLYVVPCLVLLAVVRAPILPSRRSAVLALGALVVLTIVFLLIRRGFVGPKTFYATRSIVGMEFVRGILAAGQLLVSQVEPAIWVFVLALVVGAWWAPRFLAIAALGGLVMLLAFAPFSTSQVFGMRFLYASGAGLAVALAAAVLSLAQVPRVGKPAALVLVAVLLTSEWREVRGATHEWREAGVISRQVLDGIVAATPDPTRDGTTVVFDLPLVHGRGMLFYTYFDLALRLVHPEYRPLGIPGRYLLGSGETAGGGSLRRLRNRDQTRRARDGVPALPCAALRTTADVDGFRRALLECGSVFLAVDEVTHAVRLLSESEARERLAGARVPDESDEPDADG